MILYYLNPPRLPSSSPRPSLCPHCNIFTVRAKLDDRARPELLGCPARRDQTAREVRQVTEVHQASLACPGLRVRKARLGPTARQVPQVPRVLMVLQETEEFQDCPDRLCLSALGDLPGRKESAEWPGRLGRRGRLVLLVLRDLRDLSAPGEREERRDLLVNLELLGWAAGLVTRDLQAPRGLSALRALQDFR